MATYTEHYGLHQWVPEDNFLRSDFNTDLEKIDQALKEIFETASSKALAVTGTYAGDDTMERTIDLGFQPKALYLYTWGGFTSTYNSGTHAVYGGLALPEHPIVDFGSSNAPIVEICSTGFQLHCDGSYHRVNESDYFYYYIALR